MSGKTLKGGYIVVIQTHGRNGQYNPHLHIIATSGGWDEQAQKWVHLGYLPYPMLHKQWQWHALEMVRETLALQRHFSALTKFAHVKSRFCGRKQ